MITLAVDTATQAASAAVIQDGELRTECLVHHRTMHSRNIMPIIQSVVAEADIGKRDIDLFAVSIGPGSFTGVRIGVSTVKAMAYVLKKPTVGIYTLDALAYGICDYHHVICPVIDARNEQVYCAAYEWDGTDFHRIMEPQGIQIQELMKMLTAMKRDVVFTGNACRQCAAYAKETDFTAYEVNHGQVMPRRA